MCVDCSRLASWGLRGQDGARSSEALGRSSDVPRKFLGSPRKSSDVPRTFGELGGRLLQHMQKLVIFGFFFDFFVFFCFFKIFFVFFAFFMFLLVFLFFCIFFSFFLFFGSFPQPVCFSCEIARFV